VANATDIVKKGTVRRTDEFIKLLLSSTAAARIFWPNAMLGMAADGYVDKFDDTQAMTFVGVVDPDEGKLSQPVEADGVRRIPVHQPQRFEITITSVAVADIGKKVYAVDDQTGTLAATTAFGNLIGTVVDVVATNIALVEPVYDGSAGNRRLGAVRTMAATGNQVLYKGDLGKTIIVPNTAALQIDLPTATDCQAGDTLVFVKNTADAFAITINTPGSETIDGSATLATLDANYDTATLMFTGTIWIVLNRDIA
jgi:hypothetical protein